MSRSKLLFLSMTLSLVSYSCISTIKVHYTPSDEIKDYFYDIREFDKALYVKKLHKQPIAITAFHNESIMLFIHDIDSFSEGQILEVNKEVISCIYNFEAHMRFVSTKNVVGTIEIRDYNSRSDSYRIKLDLLIDEPRENFKSELKGKYSVQLVKNPRDNYKVFKYQNEKNVTGSNTR